MRPLQGQVLVRLDLPETETFSGIQLPDKRREKDSIGREPSRLATVMALGVWPVKKGRMVGYEFRKGDKVFVDPTQGKNIDAYPCHYKLYPHEAILALRK